jgi:tetratricopeptide (TPR) repeat protein
MIRINSFPDFLKQMGYNEKSRNEIQLELEALFTEIGLDKLEQAATQESRAFIASLRELMLLLENKGYYRPDSPTKLIKLLVNGLNLKDEDIFALLDSASIPSGEKSKEMEFLASCAAITQLGYIILRCIMDRVNAASSGPHVFLVINDLSPDSMIFVDFSIDSIMEMGKWRYERIDDFFFLKNTEGLDNETVESLLKFYNFFHVTSDIGLVHNIHNNLGMAYERLGMYEKSIDELKEARRLDPFYTEVHNNLAVTYERTGMIEEAIKELKEAIKMNPEYAIAHSNLGNIYAKLGSYEEAIGEIKEALRIKPDDSVTHNNLGNVYALQHKNQDALKEFEKALNVDPGYAPAHNNLANIYAESGNHEEAIKEFQKALDLNPEFPEAYFGIGSAYYDLGSYDRAAQAMVRAVYLEPELLECVPDKLMLKVRQGVSRFR